jgi:DNA mismatch repair protein PMS2
MFIDLTSAEELVVVENANVFAANGFKLETDLLQPSGQRVKLLVVPFSKGIQFGVEDVRELASMLMDVFDASSEFRTNLSLRHHSNTDKPKDVIDIHSAEEGTIPNDTDRIMRPPLRTGVRLPKLLAMYASRSCRQAVMIGTSLSEREMTNLVRQLVGIEQPWNCPHGRPTMRHLADMRAICVNRRKQLQDLHISGAADNIFS